MVQAFLTHYLTIYSLSLSRAHDSPPWTSSRRKYNGKQKGRNAFYPFGCLSWRINRTRFEDLTGCRIANISALNFLQLINSTFLKAAGTHITILHLFHVFLKIARTHAVPDDSHKGCSDAFATAMVQFGTTPCKKPSIVEMNQNAAKYLYYTEGRNGRKTNYCDG